MEMRRSSQGKSSSSTAGIHKYDLYAASNARNLLTCNTKTKPRPSKWDDAQKWLSRAPDDDGRRRTSSADDRLLLPSASQKGTRRSWSNANGDVPAVLAAVLGAQEEGEEAGETKRVDSVQSYERQRCVSLRDVGTEMTPGGSKEPSRTNTPRATLAAAPAAGRSAVHVVRAQASPGQLDGRAVDLGAGRESDEGREEAAGARTAVSPATAWDEAERAKYMARLSRSLLAGVCCLF